MTRFIYISAFSLLFLLCTTSVNAQFGDRCSHVDSLAPLAGSRGNAVHNQAVRDRLLRRCIQENKKDFESVVERSKVIRALSDSISASFEENKALSTKDFERLRELEKLVDSVRKDLKIGKVKDKDKEKKKLSTIDAVKSLTKAANDLTDEIQKISRHTVSVVTIKTTTTVLRLARFLRLSK